MNKKYLLLALVLPLLFQCTPDPASPGARLALDNNRPMDPWVFRSVLDTMPRMITFALHPDLWAAYTTQDGTLYKVWKGAINFDGPVYTNSHGPQPITQGGAYMINNNSKPWSITSNDVAIPYTYQYKGHKFTNGYAAIMHEFVLGDGTTIQVDEQPDIIEKENGQLGFERTFTVRSLPENHTVTFSSNIGSIVVASNISSDGKWVVNDQKARTTNGIETLDINGTLTLNNTGSTTLTALLTDKALIPNANDPDDEYDADDETIPLGARMITTNGCKTCHNTKVKTVGPAYLAVAKKYKTNDANIDLLARKVIKGGSGVWGEQVMNAHPELSLGDAKIITEYILSLDGEEEGTTEKTKVKTLVADPKVKEGDLIPGASVRIYKIPKNTARLADMKGFGKAIMGGIMPKFDNINGGDFTDLSDDFALVTKGYLYIDEDKDYSLRLWSDDGSRLVLDGEMIIDNDGLHGTEMQEAKVRLTKGYHPFTVDFFQGGGGKFLSFNWKTADSEWMVIPQEAYYHDKALDQEAINAGLTLPMSVLRTIPGDQTPLESVHPSFTMTQARPDNFEPRVGGLDFFADGRMVVSTWDPKGNVYIVRGGASGNPSTMSVKRIATGLAEPLGVKVVDGRIFVMQKQEITELVDTNGDEIIDEYRTLCDDWQVSANFHEFGFGLAEKDGYLYASLATAIEPGGASTNPQIPDRGKIVKVSIADGSSEFVSHGLRTPNGIGVGYNGELFVCDNQGDWLPSSKVVHIQEGAWYGSRSVDFDGTSNLEETKPLVWLPQDEIGNSPSTPLSIDVGPYKGQMIHGEVTHGGVKRVCVEEVNGKLQGGVFRFIQGLEAGVNRLAWGPDGALYAGGIGSTGNWGHSGKKWFGLQRMEYNNESTFEMLAVRAMTNGIEIEFTEPLQENDGWNAADYEIKQWYYKPTIEYGGPKLDERNLNIRSVNISENRTRVFLELDGMKENHVIYVRLKNKFISEKEHGLWTTECWYTMNHIPKNKPGFSRSIPYTALAANTLSDSEKAKGWKLLFDGTSTNGWHQWKQSDVSAKWSAVDGTMFFDPTVDARGGDILTDDEYENFELKLEWKISNCGNSGIMYNVVESNEYDAPWKTGPEMQILDNTCHPDTRYVTHRAGDLYDMIECNISTVMAAGSWNKIIIKINQGHADFWMNGHKVVSFDMFDDNWNEMIKNSKFHEFPGFGQHRKGHIVLQDHSDKVWFRNIKIREL